MNKIRTLLVDDEPDSRNALHGFLTKYCPDTETVAEADSVALAVKQIKLHEPQLVFLDINLPVGNGFDILDKIPVHDFHIVFITAFDEYALKAFKYNALDYMLKPINIDDLIKVVDRVKERESLKLEKESLASQAGKTYHSQKIALPLLDGFIYVKIEDIIRCEAEGNYTMVFFSNRPKIVISRTMGYYDEILKFHGFVRVHHHHLININHVERYQKGRGGIVTMSDQKEIDVSQRKRDDFLKLIEGRP